MDVDLVSAADRYYFGNATVRGLRDQLRENKLSTIGRKYELYSRLVDHGIRLYNDDRSDDIEDEDEDNGDPDDNKEAPFGVHDEEIEDSEEEYLEDDDGETDSSESEPEYDDEEDYGEEDEDGQDDQDQDGQDQEDQDQEDQPQDEQEQGDQGSSGKKRRRDDDSSDGGDNDDDDDAPARRRRRIGAALPLELQAVIVENLNAPGVWNLIDTAPEEYLRGDFNALILEARHQYRLDYYPRPVPAPVTPGGFRKTVPGPWPDPGLDRPLSLLEWVARRVLVDASFWTANSTRIMRVVDAYLVVYGMADPAPLPINALPNPREDLLYYFRDRDDLLTRNLTPLMHAAQNHIATAVALLLMRGADVNQAINGATALELASAAGFNTLQPWAYNTMQTAYALIGAGADVTVLGTNSRTQASVALGYLMSNIPPYDPPPQPGQEVPEDFPRIDNMFGLSIRQFLVDERSNHQDKMILALFVIMYRTMVYPRFI